MNDSTSKSKNINKDDLPTKYEMQRVMLYMYLAYKGAAVDDSIIYMGMREAALFKLAYPEVMEEVNGELLKMAQQEEHDVDEYPPELFHIELGYIGIDAKTEHDDTPLYALASEMFDGIDIDKDFTQELRGHVLREIKLCSDMDGEEDAA